MAKDIYIRKVEIVGGVEKTTFEKLSDMPSEFKTVLGLDLRSRYFFAYNTPGTSGTFNSLGASAAASSELYNRWLFKSMANGQIRAAYVNFNLPDNYVDGTNVKMKIQYTGNVADGNFKLHLGMTQMTPLNKFGDGGDTEWIESTIPAPSVTNFPKLEYEVEFDGADLVSGDSLSFIEMRQGGHEDDTNTGILYIGCIEIIYQQ